MLVCGLVVCPRLGWSSSENEILVLFKGDIFEIPTGKDSAYVSTIITTFDIKNFLMNAKVNIIIKALPKFNPADTVKMTEDGIIARLPDFSNLYRLVLPIGTNRDSVINELIKIPGVIHAESNQKVYYRITDVDDIYFLEHQWNLNDEGDTIGINVRRAWDISRGSSAIKIGIIDTGVDSLHPDLKGRMTYNGEVPHLDPISHPDNFHGTFVAGIVGAMTNNYMGIAGVDWYAKLHSERIEGTLVSPAIEAIQDAVNQGCQIINISFVLYEWSDLLYSTLVWAYQNNVLPVAAVAYDLSPIPGYPEKYGPWVCNIAATTLGDKNEWNPYAPSSLELPWVDVAAPGGQQGTREKQIYSTYFDGHFYGNFTYRHRWGTSAAAPHVSGVAGLMLAVDPDLKNYELEWLMKLSARDVHPAGVDMLTGYGIIEAYEAVRHLLLPFELSRGDVEFTTYDPVYRNFTNPILPYDLPSGYYKCKLLVADIWLNFDYVEAPWAFLSMEGFSPDEPNDGTYWMRRDVNPHAAVLTTCFYYLYSRYQYSQWIPVNKWVPVDPDMIPMQYTVIGRKQIYSPTNLVATPIPGGVAIELTWDDNSHNELQFIIERRVGSQAFAPYDSVSQDVTSYIDDNVTQGQIYSYQVYAKAQEYVSNMSNAAYAVSGLASPTDLSIKPVVYSDVSLHWIDNATIEEGFIIERRIGGGNYEVIYTTLPNEQHYVDDDIENYYNQEINYRVKAFIGGYESGISNEITITPPGIFANEDDAIDYYQGSRNLQIDALDCYHLVFIHNDKLWYTLSSDEGESWIDAEEGMFWMNPTNPSIVITSGSNLPCCVWDVINENGHMLVYAYRDYTGYFYADTLVENAPHCFEPVITIDEYNNVYVAYISDYANDGKIGWLSFSYDAPYNAVTGEFTDCMLPRNLRITIDGDNNPHIAWDEPHTTYVGYPPAQILIGRIFHGTFDGTKEVVAEGHGSTSLSYHVKAPDLHAYTSDNIEFAWNLIRNSPLPHIKDIYYTRKILAGWTDKVNLTQNSGVGDYPCTPRIIPNQSTVLVLSDNKIIATYPHSPEITYDVIDNINSYDAIRWDGISMFPKAAIIYSRLDQGSHPYRICFSIDDIKGPDPEQDIQSAMKGNYIQYTGPFMFESIYPNPTKKKIIIRFMSPDHRSVEMNLYDITGRLVDRITVVKSRIGLNEVNYTMEHKSNGIYFLMGKAGNEEIAQKIVIQY